MSLGRVFVVVMAVSFAACGSDDSSPSAQSVGSDALEVETMVDAMMATGTRDDLERCPVVSESFAEDVAAQLGATLDERSVSITSVEDSSLGASIVRCGWEGQGPTPARAELVLTAGEPVSIEWFESLVADEVDVATSAWRPVMGGQVRTDALADAGCRSVWVADGVMFAFETRGADDCAATELQLIDEAPEISGRIAEL